MCVECAKPVPSVVHADRLTQCNSCGSFADKYVEYEPTLIVLDMLLHRPSVYRHLLHNSTRLVSRGALLQLGCTLCLFDTYLKWLRLGGNMDEACHEALLPTALSSVVPALLLSLAEQVVFCAVIQAAAFAMELPAQPWDALGGGRAALELWQVLRRAPYDLELPGRLRAWDRGLRAHVQLRRPFRAAAVRDQPSPWARGGRRRSQGGPLARRGAFSRPPQHRAGESGC